MTTYLRKADLDDPILAAAVAMEPKFRQAFLDAVAAMQGTVPMAKLTEAIASGNADRVMAVLNIDRGFTAAMEGAGISGASVRDAIQATFAAGAKAAIGELPESVSTLLSFNQMSPEAVSFLGTYEMNLIREVTADTRTAVQQTVLRAFQEGGSPAVQAREIRDTLGLTASQEQAVANYRTGLESGSSDVLDRALRDQRFDSTVARAIEEERSLDPAYVDKLVGRYREKFLQYRANNVARTETVRAANAGQREAWRQAKKQGLLPDGVLRRWIASGGDRTCEVCAGLDGETAGIDEEFEPGIVAPPDPHPSCRCATALVMPRREPVAA